MPPTTSAPSAAPDRAYLAVTVGTAVVSLVVAVLAVLGARFPPATHIRLDAGTLVWGACWALLQVGFIWGWTRLTRIPDRLGARVAMMVAGAGCLVAGMFGSASMVMASVFLGAIGVGLHQLSRVSGRRRLVHSMAATTTGIVLMATSATSAWHLTGPSGYHAMSAAAVGALMSSLTAVAMRRPRASSVGWGVIVTLPVAAIFFRWLASDVDFEAVARLLELEHVTVRCVGVSCGTPFLGALGFYVLLAAGTAWMVGSLRMLFARGLTGWGWSTRLALIAAQTNLVLAIPVVTATLAAAWLARPWS